MLAFQCVLKNNRPVWVTNNSYKASTAASSNMSVPPYRRGGNRRRTMKEPMSNSKKGMFTIHGAGIGMTLEEVVSINGLPVGEEALPSQAMIVHGDRPRVWNIGYNERLRIQFSPEALARVITGSVLEVSGEKIAGYGTPRDSLIKLLGSPGESISDFAETEDIYGDNSVLRISYYHDKAGSFGLDSRGHDGSLPSPISNSGIEIRPIPKHR